MGQEELTYCVSSYLVTQRAREFGIRVTLGAGRMDIIRGVLRTSIGIAGAGIVAGVGAVLGPVLSLRAE